MFTDRVTSRAVVMPDGVPNLSSRWYRCPGRIHGVDVAFPNVRPRAEPRAAEPGGGHKTLCYRRKMAVMVTLS